MYVNEKTKRKRVVSLCSGMKKQNKRFYCLWERKGAFLSFSLRVTDQMQGNLLTFTSNPGLLIPPPPPLQKTSKFTAPIFNER